MNIRAITTDLILDLTLEEFLSKNIPSLEENSVIVIASKVVAICQKEYIKDNGINVDDLVKKKAEIIIDRKKNKYNTTITITDNILAPRAGIDHFMEKYFVFWPKKPMNTARYIRDFLAKKFQLKNIGVIISDSKSSPLQLGVTGYALGYAGFKGVNNYSNLALRDSRWVVNIAHPLAAAGTLVMGERAAERKPIAVITNIPYIIFDSKFPNQSEQDAISIKPEDDLFHVLFENIQGLENED